ncbi:hypothetical protein LOTGIDRAFT_169802 [Lottia gigantea]|uniref:Uncharacterized protein n=1 Tax=Lottia gigantea TaxID=225164 RepID=V3ZFT6_LOTGI|nr:hypothetical protein LOTGIDRAFT_169802 [Lottia gigantea]ESO82977.1 hypothetical protein LOTGIDRAFT_169802 [Lottia gigantea]
MYILAIAVITLAIHNVDCVCNKDTGPVGISECIQTSSYGNGYQWQTCVSDAYIKVITNGRQGCDGSKAFCYYPCMADKFQKTNGSIVEECSCKPGEMLQSKNMTLPLRCYNPSGVDCSWYAECLEKEFPCTGDKDDYGIAFAHKYCAKFGDRYSKFGKEGQKWIDLSRKCLQEKLVPLLYSTTPPSCNYVKEFAFKSHIPCYLQPSQQVPEVSVCKLGALDFFKLFWTLKETLVSSVDISVSVITSFFKILRDC